nr:hypothetical protein E2R29_02670 [Burkholderia pseudomallei]
MRSPAAGSRSPRCFLIRRGAYRRRSRPPRSRCPKGIGFGPGLMGRVQQHLFAALGVTREPRTTH